MPDNTGLEPLVQTSPHHVTYINQIFTNFISGIGDYIRTDLFPRAKDTVISTNSKAVEMVRNRKNLAGENWSPKFPFLVITPNLDFRPDPVLGQMLHCYPNFTARFASKLYNPRLYEDDDVYIAPVVNRYVGTMEVTAWCSSIYEAIDLRVNVIQMFGGEGKIIQPRNLDCLIVIPEFLENYVYTNRYTEVSRTLDWSSSMAEVKLIRNINQERLTYPITLRPYLRLSSIDDNSDQFGGSGSSLADYRVVLQLEWEANIPVHLVMVEKKMPRPSVPITFEINHHFQYIRNPIDTSSTIKIPDEIFSTAVKDTSSGEVESKFLTYKSSENYIITADDIVKFTNNENLYITPGVSGILDSRYIRVHGKYGYLAEPVHYDIDLASGDIKLHGQNMKLLEEGDILTFIYYETT